MSKRLVNRVLILVPILAALAVTAAVAAELTDEGVIDSASDVHGHNHAQHGSDDGHLPPKNEGDIRVVGKMNINQDVEGRVSDVGVFGDYAYLGAFNERDCQKGGVYVFNIANPSAPKQINFIRAANDTYVGEGVQVIELDTPAFVGDLLIHNNETCTDVAGNTSKHALGGVSLIDVTNPKTHKYLAQGVGDFQVDDGAPTSRAHTVHSAFAWQPEAGGPAYAVLVDNQDHEDVDILDITDPRNPELIAEYDLNELYPQIIQADLGSASSFLHDIIVKEIDGRQVMLLSYWDGGYVTLDVTDPLDPDFLADSDFTNPDPEMVDNGEDSADVRPEGNAHQAEFSLDNDYIVAADEDFSPYSVIATNTTDNSEFDATQGSDTPPIDDTRSLEGDTVFVGRACTGDPAPPPGDGSQIALVERGACAFTDKVASVEAAGGYRGAIIFNSAATAGGDCTGLLNMSVAGNIPALFVGRDTGFDLLNETYDDAACKDADLSTGAVQSQLGDVGDSVSIEAIFDGWGYVHLLDNTDDSDGKLEELDTYAIPEAHDPDYADGFGDLSVHEVAMSAKDENLAYFAYYSGGFRVAEIDRETGTLEETGAFIDQAGNNFWGVQLWNKDDKEYVLASDRDYGVYIFEVEGVND